MKQYTAVAKVNVFLKVTGMRGNYHEILSRFVTVPTLFDTLHFFPKAGAAFVIEGDFSCSVEQNTIYKAYKALQAATGCSELKRFMSEYGIAVEKRIPAFAGLGGGSSDAATFLNMCNDMLSLGLSTAELAAIGAKVGADVPFFVYGYPSANVSGIGEVVEPFEELPLKIETYTPAIAVSTPAVYGCFREHFYTKLPSDRYDFFAKTDSKALLETLDAKEANDLFGPALSLYPALGTHVRPGRFFSGSGSSFFKLG